MQQTSDHETIKRWAERRGARPVFVQGTGMDGRAVIELEFPGWASEQDFEPVSWDQWFEQFEQQDLALIYEDHTTDEHHSSGFFKLVTRDAPGGQAVYSEG